MKRIVLILIMCFVAITAYSIEDTYLVLYDSESHIHLAQYELGPSKSFTMRWIHSVELEPWEEIFKVDSDFQIVLDSTRFKAFGAGVPDSAGKRVETSDGYISFLEINQPMNPLIYGISPIAKHTLIIENLEYPLHEWIASDTGVLLQIERKSKLRSLIN